MKRRDLLILAGAAPLGLRAQVVDIADAINKAGRQRMLSQRMGKAWLALVHQTEGRSAQAVLDKSMALFDRQLVELKAYAPSPEWRPVFVQIVTIVMIFASALLLTSLIRAIEGSILHRDSEETAEETPHYRRVRTQMQVIDRVLIALVWLCALAGALLTFPAFRAVGTSLIASAAQARDAAAAHGLTAQGIAISVDIPGVRFDPRRDVGDIIRVRGQRLGLDVITRLTGLTYTAGAPTMGVTLADRRMV